MRRAGRLMASLLGAVLTATPLGATPAGAVVGGQEARPHAYPYVAALVDVEERRGFCGAVLVDDRHLLTAAHCLTGSYGDTRRVAVLLGDHDLTTGTESPYAVLARPSRFTRHPAYDPGTQRDDIAVITLSRPVRHDRGVRPVRLPARTAPDAFDRTRVEVAGWGATSFGGGPSPVLRTVTLETMGNRTCAARGVTGLTPAQICTYAPGRDACVYDSGGPLVHRDRDGRPTLVGLVSYGRGCATSTPAVNTRVSAHLGWIARATSA